MFSRRSVTVVMALGLVGVAISPVHARTPPANDAFSNAVVIETLPFSARSDVTGATRSTTDPGPYCFSGPTVWFRFDYPAQQMLQASTAGSDYKAGLEVYRQTDSGLQLITCSSDPSFTTTFQVGSEGIYYFMVGPSASAAPPGELQFNLSSLGTPPANDTRAGAIEIAPGITAGDSRGATSDAEDYGPCYMSGASVWYSMVAPADGRYRASVSASGFNPMINVKELTDAGLMPLGCVNANDVPTFFAVSAGRTYYIVVGDATSQLGGAFTLTLAEAPEIDPVVTIDPAGVVDRSTGTASISGTVRCNEQASFALGVIIDQRGISGSGSDTISCGQTPAAWSVAVTPSSGTFRAGPATARAGGVAYTTWDYDYAQEVSTRVMLRSGV